MSRRVTYRLWTTVLLRVTPTPVVLASLTTVSVATWSRPHIQLHPQTGLLARRRVVLSRWKVVIDLSCRHGNAFTKVPSKKLNNGLSSVPFMYIILQTPLTTQPLHYYGQLLGRLFAIDLDRDVGTVRSHSYRLTTLAARAWMPLTYI